MTHELVTLATFPTPVEAGFVKNLLEAEGIRAFLADEITAGMFWQLGNSIGWVKLQVAEGDADRATEILEEHHRTLADVGQEAFAAEATSTPAEAEAVDEGPDDSPEDPNDELAARAFHAAGIGLIFLPILLYAAWLIGRLIFSRSELSERASRRLWLAFGITIVGLSGYWAFFRLMYRL